MQAHKEFPDDAMSNFDIGGEPRWESEMKQFIPVSNSEMEPHYECELCESQTKLLIAWFTSTRD